MLSRRERQIIAAGWTLVDNPTGIPVGTLAAANIGTVDLFPAGASEALRIDFFGDEIDALRRFDPMTQRSTAKLDAVSLKPVSEVLLDQTAITRFRGRYRDLFGTVGVNPEVEFTATSMGPPRCNC